MNLAQVARMLAGFTLFYTLVLTIPLAVAIFEDAPDLDTVLGFSAALTTGLLVSLLLRIGGKTASADFFRREGLAVVGLAWLLASGLGSLPFVWSGSLASGADAFFESVSGLTTTGATVFGSGDNARIESLPTSLLLWRSMLQWLGGMGIILVFTVLLPAMGVTGKNLLTSEQIGVSDHRSRPRMQAQSRVLFLLYIALTLSAGLLYWAAGMSGFDALCHAFTTSATAGFSTRDASIGSYSSLPIELICMVFMFLAGCNFVLLLTTLRERPFRLSGLLQNSEFRAYLTLTLFVTAAITLSLWFWGRAGHAAAMRDHYASFWTCLRAASFNSVSIITSTGYSTADFQNWPKSAIFLLLFCMFVGGCTGSTAGGLKILRLVVCLKLIAYTLNHFIRPRAVQKVKVGQEVMPNSVVSVILTVLLLWLACVGLGTLVIGLDPRLGPLSSLSVSTSMMGCTGPAITGVLPQGGEFVLANPGKIDIGPSGGYGALYGWTKVFMSLMMILGRLEILAPLVLLAPAFWRR